MPKTDSLMGKIILVMLSIIIALVGTLWATLNRGISENGEAIERLRNKVETINILLAAGDSEKEQVQKDLLRLEKRLDKHEGERP